MRLEYREDPWEWRKFTWLTLPPPWIVTGYLAWRGWVPLWVWGMVSVAAVVVAVSAWMQPSWFRSYYRAGVWFGFQVARLVGYMVLALIFWLVVVPMGWGLRLRGRDLLRLRRDPSAESYWHRSPPSTSLERLF